MIRSRGLRPAHPAPATEAGGRRRGFDRPPALPADGDGLLERRRRLGHRFGAGDLAAAGGAPLPASVRRESEEALEADLGAVRWAVDGRVGHLDADAVARGEQLRFAPGAFQPGTREGRRLLFHELTHVLQNRVRPAGPRGAPRLEHDPRAEAEADRTADRGHRPGAPAVPAAATPAPTAAPNVARAGKTGERHKNRSSFHKRVWSLPLEEREDSDGRPISEPLPDDTPRRRGYKPPAPNRRRGQGKRVVAAEPGPRTAITGLPQPVSRNVLANVMGGKPPLRPELGTHGRVSWATVTHHGRKELPSRPYSGREDPSNALMQFHYDMERDDRHVAEESVSRVHQGFLRKAVRHRHRVARSGATRELGPKKNRRQVTVPSPLGATVDLGTPPRRELTVEPDAGRFRDEDPHSEGEAFSADVGFSEDEGFADDEGFSDDEATPSPEDDRAESLARDPRLSQRLRKTEQRRRTGKARKSVDRTVDPTHEAVVRNQVAVRTWKHLGGWGEGEHGRLTSMSIPGGTSLSRPSGEFVVMPQSGSERFRLAGQKSYAKPPSRIPSHPLLRARDMERFVSTLDPKSYEKVLAAPEPEPEPPKPRRSRRQRGAGRHGRGTRGGTSHR